MSFFGRLLLIGTGFIGGVYIDQKYHLPNVETKFNDYYEWIKKYEPPKK
jgi:hypothetical protein